MAVNDEIYKNLEVYGGSTINERVYNYLGSLGYTGTISDRLAQFSSEGRKGWQGLTRAWGVWKPAQVFSQGQQGVWYEPKPEYLFQDAAGTVPVTADGDPVGYMQDLSGNGNHATQETSAARPIYRTDGVLHWLQFDGVDDNMVTGLGMATSGDKTSIVSYDIADKISYVYGDNSDSAADQFWALLRREGQNEHIVRQVENILIVPVGETVTQVTVSAEKGNFYVHNGSVGAIEVGTATSETAEIILMSRVGGFFAEGRLFSAIFLSGSSLEQGGPAYDYAANLAGIQL